MMTKNAVVEMEGTREDGESARETPQSVETLLKPLYLTLMPSHQNYPSLDFSDLDMECLNRSKNLVSRILYSVFYMLHL